MRRILDILVSLALLIPLSPLLALLGVMVRMSSPGPALYRAERVGLKGRRFAMLKFRTMVAGADRSGPGITAQNDPRITRMGRFLRATKLDELPQLLNVLKGEMSLIGPRAEASQFVEHYTPEQRTLLEVRPGATGPGQLYYTTDQQEKVVDLGRAEEVYVRDLLADKLALDLEYLRRRSLLLDLKILLQTAGVMAVGLAKGIAGLGRRRRSGAPVVPHRSGSAGKG